MEYISPGVIITAMIIIAISLWLLIGRLWKNDIVDNNVRREQLFRFLNALGLVLSARGNNKTNSLYYKSYMGFLATVKTETANKLFEYNKEIIDKIDVLPIDDINQATVELLNCIRKEYKIDKGLIKLYIADLNKKPSQKINTSEC